MIPTAGCDAPEMEVQFFGSEQQPYVAFSGYYKHLTEFVDARNATLFDFSPALAALPAGLRAQVGTPIGAASQPANNGRGYILGQEVSLSLPFSNLTEALDGFGFFGSLSHTKSSIKLGSNPTNRAQFASEAPPFFDGRLR